MGFSVLYLIREVLDMPIKIKSVFVAIIICLFLFMETNFDHRSFEGINRLISLLKGRCFYAYSSCSYRQYFESHHIQIDMIKKL